jgi:hypothetical protein
MSGVRVLERVTHAVPLGLLLRSAAGLDKVGDGLDIRAAGTANLARHFMLGSTPSAHWTAHVLPGTKADVAADPANWPTNALPYRFSISDRTSRYLPLRFDAPLPKRGSLVWPGWAGVNRGRIAPLLPPGSGASFVPDYMPLFPTVAAGGSNARARIIAHLAIRQTGGAVIRDAAWALMTVSFGSTVVGIGLSDARGAIMASFGYPPMPSQTPAEAVLGRETVNWPVRVRIYCSELSSPVDDVNAPPDFAAIIAQLATVPRVAMSTIMGGQPALGDQTLTLGQPLVLRTRLSGNQFASSLFLKPA